MSIAVDNPPMEGSGFMVAGGKRNRPVFMVQPAEIRHGNHHRSDRESDSSSSSSIGTNSSSGEGRDSDDEGGVMEVQSAFKGPFQTMDSLEESLPIRRGISNFYAGKSKSFTSLCNVASSAKDLVKPEDPYNKKRRNVLLRTVASDRNFHPCRNSNTGISKRPTNSGKTTLALAVAMNNTGKECEDQPLPPLPPSGKSFGNPNHLFSDSLQRCSSSSSSSNGCEESSPRKWGFTVRSFSLFDLQTVSNYNGEEA